LNVSVEFVSKKDTETFFCVSFT